MMRHQVALRIFHSSIATGNVCCRDRSLGPEQLDKRSRNWVACFFPAELLPGHAGAAGIEPLYGQTGASRMELHPNGVTGADTRPAAVVVSDVLIYREGITAGL